MMKLHDSFFIIIISLCLAPTTLYATEYTHYFLYNTCGYKNNQSCWLKVITDEDKGGLRCRASASLRSAIKEVVPRDQYVQVIDLAISQPTGRAFFQVSRNGQTCYMRATKDRFSYLSDYTHNFFHQQGCYHTQNGCSFEVITDEDNGGLRCRASASLQSPIIEVVPKGDSVSVIDLAISEKDRAFFKVFRGQNICYMRATQSRLFLVGKKESPITTTKIPSSPQKNTQTVSGKKIFITHLGFMDTSAGMPLDSSIAKPISQAVINGIQLAQQDISHLQLNESGHQIENSDENVNQFVNLFWDFNLTRSEKIEAIIQQMMTPNQVDVIVTGQYLEKTGGIIHIRPSLVSKNQRRIMTKSLIFQEQEFICANQQLCQDAHQKISNLVKELLENL